MEEILFDAIKNNCVEEAVSLLRNNPGLDVNWRYGNGWTALHSASWRGHVEVVKLLLAHPSINVNLKNVLGSTPLFHGCTSGYVAIVRLMLEDPRVTSRLLISTDALHCG